MFHIYCLSYGAYTGISCAYVITVYWEHKFLSDVTGCRKAQVSDCTSYTVLPCHTIFMQLNNNKYKLPVN